MNSDETTAQLKGIICEVDKPCRIGGIGGLPEPGGAFEPKSNE
jgi:hypothetical protein